MPLLDDPETFAAYRRRLARVTCRDPDRVYDEHHRNAADGDGFMGCVVEPFACQDFEDQAGNAPCHLEGAGLSVIAATAPFAAAA